MVITFGKWISYLLLKKNMQAFNSLKLSTKKYINHEQNTSHLQSLNTNKTITSDMGNYKSCLGTSTHMCRR